MKRMTHSILATLVFLMAASAAAAGPNFSGDWKMNASKSDFGVMPAPASIVSKVTHNDPELKVANTQVSDMGEFSSEMTYTTDGKECVNKVRELDVKSIVKWEGDTLVFDSKLEFQGSPLTMSDKWTLSADGKTLTMTRSISGPMGNADSTLVFDKQ
jgi:hypothetical protein